MAFVPAAVPAFHRGQVCPGTISEKQCPRWSGLSPGAMFVNPISKDFYFFVLIASEASTALAFTAPQS